MISSLPVVIANNQSSIQVNGTIANTTVSSAYDTGATAFQVLLVNNLGSNLLGQMVMASSLPVVIASNQSTVPVKEVPASGIYSGYLTMTGSAQRITTNSIDCKYVYFYNHSGNNTVYWGGSTATTNHPAIPAGAGRTVEINNVNKLYVAGVSPQIVGYAYSVQ
jgi:hypothetical protein